VGCGEPRFKDQLADTSLTASQKRPPLCVILRRPSRPWEARPVNTVPVKNWGVSLDLLGMWKGKAQLALLIQHDLDLRV
jgi:hypothetical protein